MREHRTVLGRVALAMPRESIYLGLDFNCFGKYGHWLMKEWMPLAASAKFGVETAWVGGFGLTFEVARGALPHAQCGFIRPPIIQVRAGDTMGGALGGRGFG